jgi:hypothetical protein
MFRGGSLATGMMILSLGCPASSESRDAGPAPRDEPARESKSIAIDAGVSLTSTARRSEWENDVSRELFFASFCEVECKQHDSARPPARRKLSEVACPAFKCAESRIRFAEIAKMGLALSEDEGSAFQKLRCVAVDECANGIVKAEVLREQEREFEKSFEAAFKDVKNWNMGPFGRSQPDRGPG